MKAGEGRWIVPLAGQSGEWLTRQPLRRGPGAVAGVERADPVRGHARVTGRGGTQGGTPQGQGEPRAA